MRLNVTEAARYTGFGKATLHRYINEESHLEPVTASENVRRGFAARREAAA